MTEASRRNKEWRERNPLMYSYMSLRDNAKRRGKEFTITFEYFKRFAIRTDYINKKGITAQAYHVDRIDETKGYVPGNLQALPNIDNVQKYVKFKYRDQLGAKFTTKRVEPAEQWDCPF
jgi:hypothetical protein